MGERPPLSDRVPRNNGDARGPRQYGEVKATPKLARVKASPESESTACRHSNRRNLGDPLEVNMMLNSKIKKDNFKTKKTPQKEVRLIHTSREVR